MTHLIKLIVLIVLLSVSNGLLHGQDTTCDSGDILWVVETVNADEGVVGGAMASEYNNFATPFGIQAAFDEACAGAIIRIVAGANTYGPSSASWNNRDATTKQINVDTVDCDGTVVYCRVEGWVDETTKCGSVGNRWTASCPVVLDFDRDNITGADGFNHGAAGDGYVYEWIGVTNVDLEGFDPILATNVSFYFVSATNVTNRGISGGNTGGVILGSYFANVGTVGESVLRVPFTGALIAYNVIDCAPGGTPTSGQDGVELLNTGHTVYKNVVRNCHIGIDLGVSNNAKAISNVVRDTVSHCINGTGANPAILGNAMSGCGGDSIAFNEGTTEHLYTTFHNSYGAADQLGINAGSFVELDLDDAVNDNGLDFATVCLFADDTDDFISGSGCSETFWWGNGQVQSINSIIPGLNDFGQGGGPGLMIQGVR